MSQNDLISPGKYVVVKNAGDNWREHWRSDPKVDGVTKMNSANLTFTGEIAGCLEMYEDQEAANQMALKMAKMNPNASYAVCPFIDTGFILNVVGIGARRLRPPSPFGEQ